MATDVKNGHRQHLINRILGWLPRFMLKNIKFQITISVELPIQMIQNHGAIPLIQLRVVQARKLFHASPSTTRFQTSYLIIVILIQGVTNVEWSQNLLDTNMMFFLQMVIKDHRLAQQLRPPSTKFLVADKSKLVRYLGKLTFFCQALTFPVHLYQ